MELWDRNDPGMRREAGGTSWAMAQRRGSATVSEVRGVAQLAGLAHPLKESMAWG